MNNGNDSMGITVVTTVPKAHQCDIAVDTTIQLTFSADLNRSTLNNCIVVFEDYKGIYNGVSSLKNSIDFNVVKGALTYDNRTITFTPEKELQVDTKYIVVINNTIKDITGSPMLKKYIFAFNTEIAKSFGACEIISPKYGSISSSIPEIHWKDLKAPSYIVQISKSNQFESLLFETFIVPNKDNTYFTKDNTVIPQEELKKTSDSILYNNMKDSVEYVKDNIELDENGEPIEGTYKIVFMTPDIIQKEGVYYIRIKAEGGKWSDVYQFFIKEVTDAVVAAEDQSDELYLDEFLSDLEDEIEVLEMFPDNNSILNSLKTNIIYIKIKGIVDESRINFSECEIIGEPFDEEDDEEYEQGLLLGSWSTVYDDTYDCTYLIFTPVNPEEEQITKTTYTEYIVEDLNTTITEEETDTGKIFNIKCTSDIPYTDIGDTIPQPGNWITINVTPILGYSTPTQVLVDGMDTFVMPIDNMPTFKYNFNEDTNISSLSLMFSENKSAYRCTFGWGEEYIDILEVSHSGKLISLDEIV
jgi:hypothetical protein